MTKQLWPEYIEKMEQSVRSLYALHTPPYLIYHNIHHTELVVKNAIEIASHYALNDEDMFVLQAAAWFHDTGQMFSKPSRHEEESVRIVNKYLGENTALPAYIITAIDSCIMATKMPQRAQSLAEQILCDADLYHLGTSKFWSINEAVKQEAALRGFNIENWEKGTLQLLQMHHYYTGYCKATLDAGKADNIRQLIARLER